MLIWGRISWGRAVNTPALLWVDLRSNKKPQSSERLFFSKHCLLNTMEPHQITDARDYRNQPAIFCLEYDYPSHLELKLLQHTKRLHPHCPLLMLTKQHSEALAVWAFRSGAWDYLATPLGDSERSRALHELQALANQLQQRYTPRLSVTRAPDMPREGRFRGQAGENFTLMQAVAHIERHSARKLCLEEVARHCNMSVSKFSRLFKRNFALTFQEYLVLHRIGESLRLLRNPHATVSEVAYTVGFNDPSYFTRAFKRHTGVLPSEFREVSDPDVEKSLLLNLLAPAVH